MKITTACIAKIVKEKGAILRAKDLRDAGLSFVQIRRWVEKGVLEKLDRGVYRFAGYTYDERVEMARRIPTGIFCIYSACHLHNLSDFVPSEQHLAVPKKSRYVLPDYPPVKLYYWEKNAYETGVILFQLPDGEIRTYDPEKTVCDMFRLRNKVGLDMAKEVTKNYLQRADRNLAKLHEYARQLRIEQKMNDFLMVLL
jgi:predicted transcriptional regulator of viral defense system